MSESNVDKHRTAHQRWTDRDFEHLVDDFVEDVVYEDRPRALSLKGRQAFLDWTKMWVEVFSDGRIVEARYIDGGEYTVATFLGTGTNDGPIGPFPASGRELTFPLCEIIRWDDGKAVSGEIYYDLATILSQAGHIDLPTQ